MPDVRSSTRMTRSGWLIAILLTTTLATAQHYTQTNLTRDVQSVPRATNIDPNLVNAWGLARGSSSFWWVADNGTGRSTLYDGAGVPQALVVNIPGPNGGVSAPTGAVFNFTTSFRIAGTPASFLFVTEDGTIAGWHPPAGTTAVIAVNRSGRAVYKGCTIARTRFGPRLYATNFTTGTIDVFDGNFRQIFFPPSTFRLPGLPQFVPFNVQNVGGNLVVTYAFRQPGSEDEQHGPGLGAVAIFDTEGRRLRVLQTGSFLNAPWGVTLAPYDFGAFSHRLLIGNFGDGRINAFNIVTGAFEGALLAPNNRQIRIDGLWSLGFGNGTRAGSATTLFFTAGPNDEKNGLFGTLTPVNTELRGNTE